MQDIKARISDLVVRLDKLKEALGIPEKKKKIEILEGESLDPKLWDDPERARKVGSELADLKKELKELEDLTGTITTLKELSEAGEASPQYQKEIAGAEKTLQKLELLSFLGGEYDAKNALVSVHAGQGGTEADFGRRHGEGFSGSLLGRLHPRIALEVIKVEGGDS